MVPMSSTDSLSSPSPSPSVVSASDGRLLLRVANESIAHGLAHSQPLAPDPQRYPPSLRQPGASFVTLHLHGELRGCIGSLEAHRPLLADVAHNAFAAAFRDPRFSPLRIDELLPLQIHLSILSAPVPMAFASQDDLLAQLRPGVDGLILADLGRRGTFLPAVWESLPDRQQFLAHLKAKAGLPADHWSNTLRVWRYTTQSIP